MPPPPPRNLIRRKKSGSRGTARNQLPLNGKTDAFITCARAAGLKTAQARAVIGEVAAAVRRWPELAAPAGIPPDWTRRVAATHRLVLMP